MESTLIYGGEIVCRDWNFTWQYRRDTENFLTTAYTSGRDGGGTTWEMNGKWAYVPNFTHFLDVITTYYKGSTCLYPTNLVIQSVLEFTFRRQ